VTEKRYRIAAAAELTGLSEGLLRAWERRYRVLVPTRTAGGYRAYSEAELEVLRALKKLTDRGVPISEAVRQLPAIKRSVRERVGGTAPSPEQVAKWTRAVLVAAERLDQHAVARVLDDASRGTDAVSLFESLLAPLEREVGERWHAGTLSVAEEHLVTGAVRELVMSLLQRAPRRSKRHVVCACFPDEQHELGLMGAALRFRHHGWRVTFLGALTPPEHLGKVVRVTRPELIALSAVSDPGEQAFARTLGALVAERGRALVVVGGRAAERYPKLVEKAGARLVVGEAQWAELLG